MTTNSLTISVDAPSIGGKGGKGGTQNISNADFIKTVFKNLPEGEFCAVCTKSGDPTVGGYPAKRADRFSGWLQHENNNFVACSSFKEGANKSFRVLKDRFARYHFILLDDLGTKIPLDLLGDFKLSWLIETSPGNHQGGILLSEPIHDQKLTISLMASIINAGLCDPGASGPLTRWARLPVGINGKTKYASSTGAPFNCRLVEWQPDNRYTVDEIIDGLQLKLKANKHSATLESGEFETGIDQRPINEIENMVVSALKSKGLYKTPLGSGKHDVTCPWVNEHTDALDTGSAYFAPDEKFPSGGFCCQHSHGRKYRISQFLNFLGLTKATSQKKPVIRIVAGELHQVVEAAEKALADRGHHYQSGGLIVSVSTDPTTGDPAIVPTSAPALTKELSIAADWLKFDGRKEDWVRCDPPTRHTGILFEAQKFTHLLPLAGVVRQPYFRETDRKLIHHAGYDTSSHLFGVFDPRQFVIPEPTISAAQASLNLLDDLLNEFHFVNSNDRAAALSAIITAVVRPTLEYAPAFHVHAPVFGSGKTYLCELIGAFAGPGGNAKVSYPTTTEEATKVILSLLLTSPAVIEFDDMDTDWIPHGTIKRMLTADKITDRILGVSKTATVSTRTLFLGSGNNVGPVRDLLRRVLTIHIDPRCATPATISYEGSPVEKVRKNRGAYVSAVLNIILAWQRAGCPRADVENIVTFGGGWSDYCRHPLIWLGHPDPASSLLDQVKHDPDGDALNVLMTEWRNCFGNSPVTVRKAIDRAELSAPDLLDAMNEFPISERGVINRSKLGWILKKNSNRVVNGFEFQKSSSDGRVAWRVAEVKINMPSFKQSDANRLSAELEVEV